MRLLPPKFNKYYEPFAGGLALLTELYNKDMINRAVISDTNKDLINLYRVVQTNLEDLADELEGFVPKNTADFYYKMREEFNSIHSPTARKTALFLYLNRYGFNGVWRVNSKGEFNVPFGSHVNPSMQPISRMIMFSKMLAKVEIMDKSFEKATRSARKGDFVYFDPPYLHNPRINVFTNYTSQGFTLEDQKKLSENFKKLHKRGVYVMLSNSDVLEVDELYHGFNFHKITANRMVNSNAEKRKGFKEVIITNYKPRSTLDPFVEGPVESTTSSWSVLHSNQIG